MRYLDSLRFVIKREGWFLNLVLCGVCLIIPVIGPIVLHGYMFEVFDAIRRDGEGRDYPKFTFDRFSPYLMRGIWPFLAQFLMQLVVTIPIMFMYFLAMGTTLALSKGGGGSGAVIAAAWITYIVVAMLLGVLSSIFVWPMILFMGIRQKFEFGAMMSFTRDFVKRNWKELILSLLFAMAVALVLGPLGYLALCVGVLLVGALVMFSQHHMLAQMYELHLQRGGIPVEGKPLLSVEIVTPDTSIQPGD